MRDTLFQLESIVRDNGNRAAKSTVQLTSQDAFEKINDALYGNDESQLTFEEQCARFNVCPLIDVFNNWKIFLIEEQTQARIIYQNLMAKKISEKVLDSGEFENVIREAYEKISQLYDDELT